METIDIVSIITISIQILGLFFVGRQIKVANKQNKLQSDIIKRETALKMAKYFMQLISGELEIISAIYRKTKVSDIYRTIEYNDLKFFDKYEMKRLLDYEVSDIRKLYDSDITKNFTMLWDTYIEYNPNVLGTKKFREYSFFDQNRWDEKKIIENKEQFDINLNDNLLIDDLNFAKMELVVFYTRTRRNLLNKLEYFSMHFTCELADEKIVYQSLHQVYLSTIKVFYGWIVRANDRDGKDKYYTNIIKLYNLWAQRDGELLSVHIENERNSILEAEYDANY